MAFQSELFPPAIRLPHLGRPIVAAGDNPLAIGGKGHTINPIAMPFQREKFPATARLPDLGRVIITAGDNPPAVRGEGHRAHAILVAAEGCSSLVDLPLPVV